MTSVLNLHPIVLKNLPIVQVGVHASKNQSTNFYQFLSIKCLFEQSTINFCLNWTLKWLKTSEGAISFNFLTPQSISSGITDMFTSSRSQSK